MFFLHRGEMLRDQCRRHDVPHVVSHEERQDSDGYLMRGQVGRKGKLTVWKKHKFKAEVDNYQLSISFHRVQSSK